MEIRRLTFIVYFFIGMICGLLLHNQGVKPVTISATAIIGRLLLAAFLGGLIGWERDLRNKQAGVKTHLLVSVGAASIMLLSIYGFNETINHVNARFDPARLAHGVISGIGFLGAGAILKHSNRSVTGITTAATLWVVSAIGLAVGSGFYLPALVTTGIVMLTVFVLRGLEERFLATYKFITFTLTMKDEAQILGKINKLFKNEDADIESISMSDEYFFLEEGYLSMDIRVKISSKKNILELSRDLGSLDGIKQVKLNNKAIPSRAAE
ncbi:MgtC/SapB family protein [Neobacillus sp. SCS-31]|uniref:MgtC/SapB family protein n=1 Tax=Neobacillus oceani TaxID=3115292 RepID=UPI003905F462